MARALLLLPALLLGVSPCFGDKPITCEAWKHVYTCDKYGCVDYGLLPLSPPSTPEPSHFYDKYAPKPWPTDSGALMCANLSPAYTPDGNGIAVLNWYTEGCSGGMLPSGWEQLPNAIPQSDFAPVKP
jgi:hypothetical protein